MTSDGARVCVSVGNCTIEECRRIVGAVELCELRLDLLPVDVDLKELLQSKAKVVVTFRAPQDDTPERRAARLSTMSEACRLGAAYIDIEIEAEKDYRDRLLEIAGGFGTKVIISYHNFDETPDLVTLKAIVDSCFAFGGEIAKVACNISRDRDTATLIALLTDSRPLVVIGMGKAGTITRIAAPFFGSLFTYVTPTSLSGTAPGQLSLSDTQEILQMLASYGMRLTP